MEVPRAGFENQAFGFPLRCESRVGRVWVKGLRGFRV